MSDPGLIREFKFTDVPKCGHCGEDQVGRATYNMTPLCHPNDESKMDCYKLVSLDHHEMPCYPCQTGVGEPGHSHD